MSTTITGRCVAADMKMHPRRGTPCATFETDSGDVQLTFKREPWELDANKQKPSPWSCPVCGGKVRNELGVCIVCPSGPRDPRR